MPPRSWREWDERVPGTHAAHDELPFLTDEDIIELLASGEPEARKYELRILATELTNRLVRFRRLVDQAATDAHEGLRDADAAAQRADERTKESSRSIANHIEVRQDEIENEPRLARQAHAAARETRDAVEDLRGTEKALGKARREIGRHARDPDPGA